MVPRPKSTGFAPALPGSASPSAATASPSSSGTVNPAVLRASAATPPGPPPSLTTATPRPRGRTVVRNATASSNNSRGVSARCTPAARQRASTANGAGASDPVCDRAERAPATLRPGARSTTGRPDDDHRRSRPGERAAVPEVLGIHGHDAGELVVRQTGKDVGRGDVGLVSQSDVAREPAAPLAGPHDVLLPHGAALRHEGDVAGGDVEVGHGFEAAAVVGETHAVRPEEDGASLPDAARSLCLARSPIGASLTEPGEDADEGFDAHGQGLVEDGLEDLRRGRDDHELRRLGQVGERRMQGAPVQRPAAPVHEVHLGRPYAARKTSSDVPAPLGRVGRGADHRDRARREQRSQVPQLALISPLWHQPLPDARHESLA